MPKKSPPIRAESYPGIARWIAKYGTIEFGYCLETRSSIRVLDEGGLIWSVRASYPTFTEALADCEANVTRLLRVNCMGQREGANLDSVGATTNS